MQTNIDITKAFMDSPSGVLSIHQLSQKLKLPYGTTYNRVHLLFEQKILQILPQGKAKLCALDGENPMTANLLALGGAQSTQNFMMSLPDNGKLLKKIIKTIKTKTKGKIASAILISPDSLKSICKDLNSNLVYPNDFSNIENTDSLSDYQSSIDFFFIKSDDQFDENNLETEISSMLSTYQNVSITSMVVDKETLLGMLGEEENNAGFAAYTMLHDGIILHGFENFYEIILEAFNRKLGIHKQ